MTHQSSPRSVTVAYLVWNEVAVVRLHAG